MRAWRRGAGAANALAGDRQALAEHLRSVMVVIQRGVGRGAVDQVEQGLFRLSSADPGDDLRASTSSGAPGYKVSRFRPGARSRAAAHLIGRVVREQALWVPPTWRLERPTRCRNLVDGTRHRPHTRSTSPISIPSSRRGGDQHLQGAGLALFGVQASPWPGLLQAATALAQVPLQVLARRSASAGC